MKVKLREFAKPLCESGYLNLYVYFHPEKLGKIIPHFDRCILFFKGVGEPTTNYSYQNRWSWPLRTQIKWEKAGPGLNLETSEAFAVKLGGKIVHPGWAGSNLETQTTIYKWMFGETTIFYTKIWNHPIETTIYKWLFGVPGIIHGVILLMKKRRLPVELRLVIYPVIYTGFYTSLLVQDFCSINSITVLPL